MTYTVRDSRLIADAIVARIGSSTSKAVGDTVAPADTSSLPYVVVYDLGEDITTDRVTLGDDQQTAELEYQVTSVGSTARSARWMSVQVRTALSGWTPTVEGVGFGPMSSYNGPGSVTRDDGVQPPLFYAVDRFVMFAN